VSLKNIPPLYASPRLPGEGIWEWKDLPVDEHGEPFMYKTSYRPSVTHPNAIAHLLVFDMKKLTMALYLGSSEPGASNASSKIEPELRAKLVAVTNALWKQKHAGEAGGICRGELIRPLFPGMATLVTYKDGSVDIIEWSKGIPLHLIRDAKQLRHLIVKDGRVVDYVIKGGERADSEIGLGFLLPEDESAPQESYWGGFMPGRPQPALTDEWYIATRSAFGIRGDGALVFAIGHHISTKDLAKALVLAGCERAMHGDANPHNVVGNIYYTEEGGGIVRKAKLSPDQKTYTLQRYVDSSYTSDFYAFFRREPGSAKECREALR
jgi:hypothetical protein